MGKKSQTADPSPRRFWHVTVTVGGPSVPEADVCDALERLAAHNAFLLSARYSADRAEVRYWEEGADLRSAAARGLVLWSDYTELAALPPWEVVGLEVVDQDTHQGRDLDVRSRWTSVGAGQVRPF